MQVKFNGELLEIENALSIHDFLSQRGILSSAYFAVAINRQFVPRNQYRAIIIKANDVIDIVTPMQGG